MCPFIMLAGKAMPTYGICMVLAIVLVISLLAYRGKKEAIIAEDVLVIATVSISVALICAKLLYIGVTYRLGDLLEYIENVDFSFLEGGGFVYLGGMLGGIAGAFIGARIVKIELAKLEKLVVPLLPLGHAIGRIGCALAGCCYGVPYEGIGAIHYKNSIFGLKESEGCFPVQFLEAFVNCLVAIVLYLLASDKVQPGKLKKYDLLFLYIFCYSIERFFMEFLRGDIIRGIYAGLSTSQWLSILLCCICIIRLLVGRYAIRVKE